MKAIIQVATTCNQTTNCLNCPYVSICDFVTISTSDTEIERMQVLLKHFEHEEQKPPSYKLRYEDRPLSYGERRKNV